MIRMSLLLAALAAAFAVAVPAAFADGTPTNPTPPAAAPSVDTSKIQADVDQLNTDVHARHAALDADINQVTTDASAGADAATIQADIQKLKSDFQQNEAVVKTDRQQVETDAKALVQAADKGDRKATREAVHQLLSQARQALKTELEQFKQENQQARDAARAALKTDREQHRKAGQPAKGLHANGGLHGHTKTAPVPAPGTTSP
jgi:hypothetical protein